MPANSNSKHLPWTKSNCKRIVSYPSQIISVFIDKSVVHVTIDSGATVSFIVESLARKLNLKISKASQLARQADGATMLQVIDEVHVKASRGSVEFSTL